METSNTSAFAGYSLQVICGQEWVREKCLQDLQAICSSKLLLDPALTANQVNAECIECFSIILLIGNTVKPRFGEVPGDWTILFVTDNESSFNRPFSHM